MAQFYSAKRRTTTRQIITVSVNDLDSFGQGVARHNGKTLFIPGLLPQEMWGSDQFWAEFVQPGRTCKPCVARGMVI